MPIGQAGRTTTHDVVVIGAGPYGLAAAAHLKAAGIQTQVFGEAMAFWRRNMPTGMFLRHSADIADPRMQFSLPAYADATRTTRAALQPIKQFVDYGEWFQRQAITDLDTRKVLLITATADGFRLVLDDGEQVQAIRVVIAMGLAKQDFRPAQFSNVDALLISHTSEHSDFAKFSGRHMVVIGRGQSACESAVLLSEAGAQVEIISRGAIRWIGPEIPTVAGRGSIWHLRRALSPRSAVGPFPLNWLVDAPGLIHSLPSNLREWISMRSLRPAATAWLRPRAGEVHVTTESAVVSARPSNKQVLLQLDDGTSRSFDHVLLATGYRIDVARLGVLAPELLSNITCVDGSPVLSAGCESSVRGLHFIGASAVASFGPLMRFVSGTGYAARSLVRAVLKQRGGTQQRLGRRYV